VPEEKLTVAIVLTEASPFSSGHVQDEAAEGEQRMVRKSGIPFRGGAGVSENWKTRLGGRPAALAAETRWGRERGARGRARRRCFGAGGSFLGTEERDG
jgi:hypothetical protein